MTIARPKRREPSFGPIVCFFMFHFLFCKPTDYICSFSGSKLLVTMDDDSRRHTPKGATSPGPKRRDVLFGSSVSFFFVHLYVTYDISATNYNGGRKRQYFTLPHLSYWTT